MITTSSVTKPRDGTPLRTRQTAAAVDSLRRIVRALRCAAQRTQQLTGISGAQLYVLRQLDAGATDSLTGLAARTLTDRSSVAAVVARLESRSLVTRSPSIDDRRRSNIEITRAGRALLRRAPQPPATILVTALASMGDADLRALARTLGRLTTAMEISDYPASMLFEDVTTTGESRSRLRRASAARQRPVA